VPDTSALYERLINAENELVNARAAIINEIIARLGDVSPGQFALVTGLTRSNFYALLKGKWNAVIAAQALLALDGTPSELPMQRKLADAVASNGKAD